MNSAHPKPTRLAPVLLLIMIHLMAIVVGGYFLSPEFTLYPYLVSRGFLPYVNIIDQHFPSLIFGPLAFPSWLTTSPFPLLIIFCTSTGLTDIFLYFSLMVRKNKFPLKWLFLWIVISYWFSGNTLWLESFISFFLALIFFLGGKGKSYTKLALGFLFAMTLLVKPTLLPLLVLLFVYLRLTPDSYFIAGFLLPLLTTALFLTRFGIVSDFIQLTITFNRQYYVPYAAKIPSLRQIIETSIIFVPPLYLFLRKKKIFPALIIVLSSVLIFPRFEYIHLQPALFLLVLLASEELNLTVPFLLPVCLVIFSLSVVKNLRHHYGNFYLDTETIKVSSALKTRPGTSLYVLGGNDLLYPLTNRVPPLFTYLPSLPWYWQDEKLAQKVVAALASSPETLVLIRNNASLDGANIQKSTGLIGRYVMKNYQPIENIESYQVYRQIIK